MRRGLLVIAGTAVACAALTTSAYGQGSAVYTHSACMSARNGAGIAAPCRDASAVFYNPAALAMQPSMIGVGVTGIRTDNTFTYKDPSPVANPGTVVERDPALTPVPHAYASFRVGERVALGLGAWAPYGLGIEWPLDFEGRYVSYKTGVRGIYIQPTLAFQLVPNRVSIGLGVDAVRGSIEINQRMDLGALQLPQLPVRLGALLPATNGVDFADVGLSGNAWGVTGHVALFAQLSEKLAFGARYMHSVDLDLEGDADFTQINTGIQLPAGNPLGLPAGTPVDGMLTPQFGAGGPLVDQTVKTTVPMPAQAVVGIAYQATPALNLMVDGQWYGWSKWDAFPLEMEAAPKDTLLLEYDDAYVLRLGADFTVSEALTLRAGFTTNTAAAPDVTVTPLLPENERSYVSGGLSYDITPGLGVDGFFMYVMQPDRAGRVRGREPNQGTELNIGTYTADAFLFGVTLAYRFGASR